MLQTIRNTTVEFKLNPGGTKGLDQSRATQILLTMESGEDNQLFVEVDLGLKERSKVSRSSLSISVGDWCVIPPGSGYNVRNESRSRSGVILAHVVACDNVLFKSFLKQQNGIH